MNKNLIIVPTLDMTKEAWLMYRKSGIGASEMGAILGLSQYKSSIELFYEKIGQNLTFSIENMAMFIGQIDEPKVANLWQYWAGSEASMIENFRLNKIQRRCRNINAYVRNPKYPWIFVSLDRIINKHEGRNEGALEIKTINSYEAEKWEAGIPPSHVVQVQTQILACDFDYGELATLQDNRKFDVIPFEKNKIICENIIDASHDFYKKVEKGREIVTRRFEANRSFNLKAVEELNAELATLEPEPDGSEAYGAFMKEKWKKGTEGERSGNITELDYAKNHKTTKEKIKELTESNRFYENHLKNSIGDMEKITFGSDGFVSWKKNTNGSRIFLNKVKV